MVDQQIIIVVGIEDCKGFHELGISCKGLSTTNLESVPSVCTHRPSLWPTLELSRNLDYFH